MDGLAEWHHGERAGFQLYEDPAHAGHATLTLFVTGLEDERIRLKDGDLDPGPLERGDNFNLVRLRDPDGNLVVLAQAGAFATTPHAFLPLQRSVRGRPRVVRARVRRRTDRTRFPSN